MHRRPTTRSYLDGTPWLTGLTFVAVAICASVLLLTPAHGAAGTVIALDVNPSTTGVQDSIELPLGSEIQIDVVVLGAPQLGAFEFETAFDSSVVEFLRWSPGPFLASTGRAPACSSTILQHSVRIGCATWGPSPPGASGDGVLATVTFKHRLSGTSCPVLIDVGAASIDGDEIPTTKRGACFTVNPAGGGGGLSPTDTPTLPPLVTQRPPSTATLPAAMASTQSPLPTSQMTLPAVAPTWTPSPKADPVTPAATLHAVSDRTPSEARTTISGPVSSTSPTLDLRADAGSGGAARAPSQTPARRTNDATRTGYVAGSTEGSTTAIEESSVEAHVGADVRLPASTANSKQHAMSEAAGRGHQGGADVRVLLASGGAGLLALGTAGATYRLHRSR
jgi:hypothetical protein